MEILNFLSHHKKDIAGEWLRRTMEAYPAESLKVLQRNKDRFTNPLLHLISESIEKLFVELIQGLDRQKISSALEQIVKLKAVQDFTPSESLEFIFILKDIIRRYVKKHLEEQNKNISQELYFVEQQIDKLALIAFDMYVKDREKLFEIQVQEVKNQTYMLIRQANEMSKQEKRGKK